MAPFFIREELSTLTEDTWRIETNLKTLFSSKFEASLNSSTTLNYTYNGNDNNRRYSESLSLKIRSRIARNYTLDISSFYNYYYSPTVTNYNRSDFILNLSAGRIFGKKHKFHIFLSATDLLDQQKNISLIMQDDYIKSSKNLIIGRNFIFKAEYKF